MTAVLRRLLGAEAGYWVRSAFAAGHSVWWALLGSVAVGAALWARGSNPSPSAATRSEWGSRGQSSGCPHGVFHVPIVEYERAVELAFWVAGVDEARFLVHDEDVVVWAPRRRLPPGIEEFDNRSVRLVVDGSDVFVRSVRGWAGRWYQRVLTEPGVALYVGHARVAARATDASDPESVERASEGFRRKYPPSRSLDAMLFKDVLDTTLRLQPIS